MNKKDAAVMRSMIANGFEFRENMAVINDRAYEMEELERIALLADELIDKAIPKKPEVKDHPIVQGTMWIICPTCKANQHCRIRYNHCSHCGQKWDWTEWKGE